MVFETIISAELDYQGVRPEIVAHQTDKRPVGACGVDESITLRATDSTGTIFLFS
jgi:hypothetical protein